MLNKVLSWLPPTPEHDNLKKFMIEQLNSSINFDCHRPLKPTKAIPSKLKENLISMVKDDIKHYKERYQKEVEVCEKRTSWIRDLKISLLKHK